jgi:hypothetical protein
MPMVVLVELGYWAGRAFGWIPSLRQLEPEVGADRKSLQR